VRKLEVRFSLDPKREMVVGTLAERAPAASTPPRWPERAKSRVWSTCADAKSARATIDEVRAAVSRWRELAGPGVPAATRDAIAARIGRRPI
jgi:hypothetical protein